MKTTAELVSPLLSWKIKLTSLVCITLVLYIHSFFSVETVGVLRDFQSAFTSGLCDVAVPTFFAMSGFLFFIGTNVAGGGLAVFRKMRRRVWSLLVPYVIVCLFVPLALHVLYRLASTSGFFNGDYAGIIPQSFPDFVRDVFWATDKNSQPIAFHLWFLRNLIVIVASAPLLFYVRKAGPMILLPLFFAVYLYNPLSLTASVFWFLLGSFFADVRLPRWVVFFYPAYAIICAVHVFLFDADVAFAPLSLPLLLLAVAGFWSLMDLVAVATWGKRGGWLALLCSFTFFTYLYHEPTLNIIRKLIPAIAGRGTLGYLISFLASPIIYTALSTIVGMTLARLLPRFYAVLVGGRVASPARRAMQE